jgi:acylphosphatase
VTADRIRRRVVVSGRVQGVGFRAATRSRAEAHGLAGWVRNLPDGSVEAAFEGDPEAVEAMLGFCRAGPRFAHVERLEVCEEPVEGLRRFEFRF